MGGRNSESRTCGTIIDMSKHRALFQRRGGGVRIYKPIEPASSARVEGMGVEVNGYVAMPRARSGASMQPNTPHD